jgi:hypothetical protein
VEWRQSVFLIEYGQYNGDIYRHIGIQESTGETWSVISATQPWC